MDKLLDALTEGAHSKYLKVMAEVRVKRKLTEESKSDLYKCCVDLARKESLKLTCELRAGRFT